MDVSDLKPVKIKIMEYGVMITPTLLIKGKVVVKGRILSVNEISELITK